jgi:hypothetical protein
MSSAMVRSDESIASAAGMGLLANGAVPAEHRGGVLSAVCLRAGAFPSGLFAGLLRVFRGAHRWLDGDEAGVADAPGRCVRCP